MPATALDLDDWLGDAQIRSRHSRSARASTDELWRAAEQVRVADASVLGRAVRWRIPGTSPRTTFRELLRSYPFAVLEEGEGWSISGLCGRIWTLRRDYPSLSGPEQFRSWDETGTVRVIVANWVEAGDDGVASLVSESRVEATDRRAQLRLRALWAVVGRFERLIGGEALRAAVRRAERAPG